MPQSPITNRWAEVPLIPIPTEHTILYRGEPGAAYNHHAQVTSLQGRLYATWSNGPTHEDEPGQRMLLAASDDQGNTWSAPRVLVDRQAGRRTRRRSNARVDQMHWAAILTNRQCPSARLGETR